MRLRSSSHSAKVLNRGDTRVHLGISGFELACKAGFQRSMEKGGLCCARLVSNAVPPSGRCFKAQGNSRGDNSMSPSSGRRVISGWQSPVTEDHVSSFENRSFSRMIVFPSSSSSDLFYDLDRLPVRDVSCFTIPKIPFEHSGRAERPTCPPCSVLVGGQPRLPACEKNG